MDPNETVGIDDGTDQDPKAINPIRYVDLTGRTDKTLNPNAPKVGRPTKYSSSPRFLEKVAKRYAAGWTHGEVAKELKISLSTLHLWRSDHKEFSDICKQAREVAIKRLEETLFESANGYERATVKLIPSTKDRDMTVVEVYEWIPPDIGANTFLLKAWARSIYGDKLEHSGAVHIAYFEMSELDLGAV